jgi:hypothetical protein
MYTFGFNSIDEAANSSAIAVGISVQSEQIAATGISLALVVMSNDPTFSTLPSCSLSAMGGRVTYSITRPASIASTERLITSISTINSTQKTTSAVVQFDKGRWRVLRTYFAS